MPEFSIKDRFTASEVDRINRLKDQQRMKQVEGKVDPGLQSDFNIEKVASIAASILVPEIAPILVSMLGAEAGGKAFEGVTKLIAPNHGGIQEVADILGGFLGGFAGDPAAIELLSERFGKKALVDLAKEIYKDPEQLELFKEIVKAPSDPGSADAIAKFKQLEKVRLANTLAKKQEEELATKTRLPPEQLKADLEHPQAPMQVLSDFFVREFKKDIEQEQGSLFDLNEPDFKSYQGSTGKLIPEQEQLDLFAHRAEQLLLDFGKSLGATGKKDAVKKVEKVIENVKDGHSIINAMYDAQLMSPRISLTKLITDQLFLPVQIAFRSLGTAGAHGWTAGAKTGAAAIYAYRESYKDAIKYAIGSFREDRPLFQEALGLESGQVFGEAPFDSSPTALGWRWIHSIYSAGRKSVMSADQFAKVIAFRAEKRMSAYMMALEEADNLELVGAAKLHFADYRAEDLINQVGTDASKALNKRAILKMFEDTFTDQGKLVKALTSAINQVPGLRIIIPYLRTPAALIKQGIAISPGAPLTSSFRNDIAGSIIDQNTAIAKWAVGTMIYSHLADESAKGNVIGDGPQGAYKDVNPDREHLNSIKIGDKYFGFNHLGPFGIVLSLAADSAALYHHTDDPTQQEGIVSNVGQMLAQKSEDMPFMESISNIVHTLDAFKEGGAAKAAEEWAGQEISGFIPAPVRIANQITDPVIRKAANAIGIIKQNVPGWSESVEPKRDRFGHLQYPPVGSGPDNSATKTERLLNSLSPIPLRGDTDLDPVDKELYKYGVGFTPIPDHLTFGSGPNAIQTPLKPIDKVNWERNTGHLLKINGKNQHDYLADMIEQPWYKKLDPGHQKQQIQNTVTAFRSMGKQSIIKGYMPGSSQYILPSGGTESAPAPTGPSSVEVPK